MKKIITDKSVYIEVKFGADSFSIEYDKPAAPESYLKIKDKAWNRLKANIAKHRGFYVGMGYKVFAFKHLN